MFSECCGWPETYGYDRDTKMCGKCRDHRGGLTHEYDLNASI